MARAWTFLAPILFLVSCGRGSEPQPPPPRPPAGERLVVAVEDVPQLKPIAGEITTRKQAEALARIAGILVELKVREGDEVTRGQPIGRIVESRLDYETGANAAQVAAATAQAEVARSELRRVRYLYDRGFFAKARLDEALAAARSADAQVRAAQEQRGASAALSGEGKLLAPATGRVLHADVPQGAPVTAGMSIATVTAGPPVLRLDVPQSLAPQLHLGAAVRIEDDADLNGKEGNIVEVYPAIAGGRVRADVAVPGLSATFVGRRVSALLDVGSRRAIILPRRFVTTRFGIDYVDLLASDGATSLVPVQTAPIPDPGALEILSGVSAGDALLAPAGRK